MRGFMTEVEYLGRGNVVRMAKVARGGGLSRTSASRKL